MKVHFIAIGGSAMHNLAIALSRKGVRVSGSDDEIFDPARSRLGRYGLLPAEEGWHAERITRDLDAVVVGMHAREDNPELRRAQELGLRIYSYPEYLYEQSKGKLRIVVGGSHGKTTTTAMILHVLRRCGVEADYMVGAELKGFEVMVRLSETAGVMVIEGDEYLTSPIDRRPKFHLYHPHVAIVTGIEWDHVNVFPTFDMYRQQFATFIDLIEPGGTLIYCAEDGEVRGVVLANGRTDIRKLPYGCPEYGLAPGSEFGVGSSEFGDSVGGEGDEVLTYVVDGGRRVPLRVFGRHNLLNLTAARLACREVGVDDEGFDEAIASFEGTSKRLELVGRRGRRAVYRDFAHAPSKLRATVHAMREQYAGRGLVACMELHTFSSLTEGFLQQYAHSMEEADVRLVYFSERALRLKRLPPLDAAQVCAAFGGDVEVFTDSGRMVERVKEAMGEWGDANLLMMSSGNFDGIDLGRLAEEVLERVPHNL